MPEKCDKILLSFWKNYGFSIGFAENSHAKMFGPPKISAPYNYDFAKTANQ